MALLNCNFIFYFLHISCLYQSDWSKLVDNHLINDEVIEVSCKKNENSNPEYENLFAQIVNKHVNSNKRNHSNSKCRPLDILLLSYDSVSRSSWLQRLPQTNEFIFETMKFKLLNGYNIVGDGTPGLIISWIYIHLNLYTYIIYIF